VIADADHVVPSNETSKLAGGVIVIGPPDVMLVPAMVLDKEVEVVDVTIVPNDKVAGDGVTFATTGAVITT
jgi:hypothetical protein